VKREMQNGPEVLADCTKAVRVDLVELEEEKKVLWQKSVSSGTSCMYNKIP